MPRVSEVLAGRPGAVHTITADESVFDAVQRMVEFNIGSLVVVDEGRVAGIFTERDMLRRVACGERAPRLTPVREVMTIGVVSVEPDAGVHDCMRLMTERRIRHLPVLREGELVGVISIGDLVKFVSEVRAEEVRHLTSYITGERE